MPDNVEDQLLECLRWRYAVKRFDASRRLPDATWQALEQSLILTPSSYGLQPWRFFVITDQSVKDQMPALSWNQSQPRDCSHMVVFAARRTMDAAYVDHYMTSVQTTRGLASGATDRYRDVLVRIVEGQPSPLDWNARQVYIALGQLTVAAAVIGVDTCAMEGFQTDAYDRLLGLDESEYTSVVACAVGYRHPEDAQATARKVRFDAEQLVTRI